MKCNNTPCNKFKWCLNNNACLIDEPINSERLIRKEPESKQSLLTIEFYDKNIKTIVKDFDWNTVHPLPKYGNKLR